MEESTGLEGFFSVNFRFNLKPRKEEQEMETITTPAFHSEIPATRTTERREHPRIEVQPGVISSLQYTVVGQTLDISRGGVRFQYVASRDCSSETCRLSISLVDRSFNLNMMPIRRVWDIAVPEMFAHEDITTRYCGVSFGELLDFQILALQFLIRNYTVSDDHSS